MIYDLRSVVFALSQRSLIIDHCNKYNNNENVEILWELPNLTQTPEVSKCYWKNDDNRLALCRVVIILQLKKIKKCDISEIE